MVYSSIVLALKSICSSTFWKSFAPVTVLYLFFIIIPESVYHFSFHYIFFKPNKYSHPWIYAIGCRKKVAIWDSNKQAMLGVWYKEGTKESLENNQEELSTAAWFAGSERANHCDVDNNMFQTDHPLHRLPLTKSERNNVNLTKTRTKCFNISIIQIGFLI